MRAPSRTVAIVWLAILAIVRTGFAAEPNDLAGNFANPQETQIHQPEGLDEVALVPELDHEKQNYAEVAKAETAEQPDGYVATQALLPPPSNNAGAVYQPHPPESGATSSPPAPNTTVLPSEDCSHGVDEPFWTVSVDALLLNRSKPTYQTLLIDNAGSPNFNANGFDFPIQAGWELDLRRRLGSDWWLEARYFDVGVRGANAAAPAAAAGSGMVYNTSNALTGIFGQGEVLSSLSYASRLQSVEINLRRDIAANLTLLAGVRFVGLDDGLTVNQVTSSGGVDASQEIRAFNNLIGFQAGGDIHLWSYNRFQLKTDIKAGMYGNAIRDHFTYDSNFFPLHADSGVRSGTAAFVGEIGIRGSYQLAEQWSFVAGYELLWIDDLALAYEQPFGNTSPLLGPATTARSDGEVFYQGAIVGFEFGY